MDLTFTEVLLIGILLATLLNSYYLYGLFMHLT